MISEYIDGYEFSEELQNIIFNSNGVTIIMNCYGMYAIDTEKYWVNLTHNLYYRGMDIINKLTGRYYSFSFKFNENYNILPEIESITCGSEVDKAIDRFFKLKAFI